MKKFITSILVSTLCLISLFINAGTHLSNSTCSAFLSGAPNQFCIGSADLPFDLTNYYEPGTTTGGTWTSNGPDALAVNGTTFNPQSDGLYDLTYTVNDGICSDSETISVTVYPTLHSFGISPSVICAGDAVTITTSNDATQVQWQLDGITVNTGTSFTPTTATGATIAGGNGNGAASNQLSSPSGVFVDGSGNVYVSDQFNHRIQKWAPGATSGTTVAGGNGVGAAANQLRAPFGVFVDGSGNVYVSDQDNHRIQKWAPGATSGATVAGGNGYGAAANQLYRPTGVFVDAITRQCMYVSSQINNHPVGTRCIRHYRGRWKWLWGRSKPISLPIWRVC